MSDHERLEQLEQQVLIMAGLMNTMAEKLTKTTELLGTLTKLVESVLSPMRKPKENA